MLKAGWDTIRLFLHILHILAALVPVLVLLDDAAGEPVATDGTLGFRHCPAGLGWWNLDLRGTEPVLYLHGRHTEAVPVDLPRFDQGSTRGRRRGVPAIRVGATLVTTGLRPADGPIAGSAARTPGPGPVRGRELRRLRGQSGPPRLVAVPSRARPQPA